MTHSACLILIHTSLPAQTNSSHTIVVSSIDHQTPIILWKDLYLNWLLFLWKQTYGDVTRAGGLTACTGPWAWSPVQERRKQWPQGRERKSKLSPTQLWGCKAGFTPRRSGSGTAQDKKHEHHPLSMDEAHSDSPRCWSAAACITSCSLLSTLFMEINVPGT